MPIDAPVESPPSFKVVPMPERKPEVADQRKWSAEEMLEAVLADIRSGKEKPTCMMVFFTHEDPDGRLRPVTYTQNVTTAQRIAFHQFGITKAIEDWRS